MEQEQNTQENGLSSELENLFSQIETSSDLAQEYISLYERYAEIEAHSNGAPSLVITDEQRDLEEPDWETLSLFSHGHSKFYEDKINDLFYQYPTWSTLILKSGMYGGKSSFVFSLIDKLEERKSIHSDLLISASMGEEYITGRGYLGKDKVRYARRYGNFSNMFERDSEIAKFMSSNSDILVLDEYTFGDPEDVMALVKRAQTMEKKVILLGLDTNYLGDELPILQSSEFNRLTNEYRTRTVKCFSYVNTAGIDNDPDGTGTIRYLRINGKWVLDLGLGPLVISKEQENLVYYAPSRFKLKDLVRTPFFGNILQATLDFDSEIAKNQAAVVDLLGKNNLTV